MKTSLWNRSFILGVTLIGAAPAISFADEPLFAGLGANKRRIMTASPDAQKYFDQGLDLYFGLNHSAAIRSFQEAARLDPKCAMPHWGNAGIALASGPHINFPLVPPPSAELTWKELGLAQSLADHAAPIEQALINALTQCSPWEGIA